MKNFVWLVAVVSVVFGFGHAVADLALDPSDISGWFCQAGMRSGDECIDLTECSQYSDGCNTCAVGEYWGISSCTERQCFWEWIPKCEQFKMPTNLVLSSAVLQKYDAVWLRVKTKVSLLTLTQQENIYQQLILNLSAKVEEMTYTKMISRFTEPGLREFNFKLDSYRYFLARAREALSNM